MSKLGLVSQIWRFPVKSMQGERVDASPVGATGLPGDRACALLDVESGKIVSAKNTRHFPDIFEYRASFRDAPVPGAPLPGIEIELPDGRVVSSDDEGIDNILSGSLGRTVRLVTADEHGPGPHHDASPLSVLTHSTLEHLRQLQPASDFDVRRFRMNIIIDCDDKGFAENDWVGLELQFGPVLRVQVTEPNARCVMTTLAQGAVPQDREIFSALVKHNRLQLNDGRSYPCAGVYARIVSEGLVSVGDQIVK